MTCEKLSVQTPTADTHSKTFSLIFNAQTQLFRDTHLQKHFPKNSLFAVYVGLQLFLTVAKEAYRGGWGSGGISAQNITNDHFSTDPAKAACVNIILAPGRTNPHRERTN